MAILSRANDSTAGFRSRVSAALVDDGVPGPALFAAYGGTQRTELWVVGGANLFNDASFFDAAPRTSASRGTVTAVSPAVGDRGHRTRPDI